MKIREHRRVRGLIMGVVLTAALLPVARAATLAHIEARVGQQKYSLSEPATDEEALKRMEAGDTRSVAEFGRTTVFDRIGFSQPLTAADGSAIELQLLLPHDLGMAIKPGVYELGGTTLQPVAQGSNDGWDSQCPDTEENTPLLLIEHYARPGPDALPMPNGLPSGDLTRIYQTHHTRIRHDSARLTIESVDAAQHFIVGKASGEVSYIVPKDDDATNNRKTYDWMCRPGEYTVQTEPFDIHFALHMSRH
jgi:hypothetical protein